MIVSLRSARLMCGRATTSGPRRGPARHPYGAIKPDNAPAGRQVDSGSRNQAPSVFAGAGAISRCAAAASAAAVSAFRLRRLW